MTVAAAASPARPASRRRAILAGIIGNVMEQYDFAVYGYFAATLGPLFFPAADPTASLLAAFGVFAVGFLMRPVGGIVFGYVGDRYGRARALLLSVATMALTTFAIGLLPTYASAGLAAPALMLACRVLQGMAVGGEFTGSAVFLVEAAPAARRGLVGSGASFGGIAGILLGSAVGALVAALLEPAALQGWGWRLPFLLGLVVGGVGVLLRRTLAADAPPARHGFPLAVALARDRVAMLRLVGVSLANGVGFYLVFVYVVTWLRTEVHLPFAAALELNTLSMALVLLVVPLAGLLSDRIGRRPVLAGAAAGLLLLAWPAMALMQGGQGWAVLAGQLALALLIGAVNGVNPVTMAELLPRDVRCSGVAFAFNLTIGVAGGTSPMVATWLVGRSGSDLSPAFYVMIAAAITLATALTLRESAFRPLDPVPA
jgi:MHS family proline/betaine transporter-like MFS transporter